jgi:hypothetical protein
MQITKFGASEAEKYGTKSSKNGLQSENLTVLRHLLVARSQIWKYRVHSPLDFMLFDPNVSCKTPKIGSFVTTKFEGVQYQSSKWISQGPDLPDTKQQFSPSDQLTFLVPQW